MDKSAVDEIKIAMPRARIRGARNGINKRNKDSGKVATGYIAYIHTQYTYMRTRHDPSQSIYTCVYVARYNKANDSFDSE